MKPIVFEYAGFAYNVSTQNHSLNTTWIINSGATINMCFDKNLFKKNIQTRYI